MSAFISWRMRCCLLLLVVLVGCNAKSGLNGDTTAPEAPSGSTNNGIATRVMDATKTDDWVYFSLTDNAVVYPAQPQNSRDWDIAFQRFKIKVNGGVSGSGGVQVAALKDTAFDSVQSIPSGTTYYGDRSLNELSDSELIALDAGEFFAVCATGFTCINTQSGTVDRTHLNADTAAYALLTLGSGLMYEGRSQRLILGWYDYFFDDNHRLAPAGDTWLIKTVDGIDIKLEMLGYYGLADSSEAGNMAFRYQSLTPGFTVPDAGAAQLKADLQATPVVGMAPLPVQFGATVSGGTATQWHWDFGDGASADGATVSHTYLVAGNYVATLTVTDQRGAHASKAVTITVNAAGNQRPVANAGADINIMLDPNETQTNVALDGSGSIDAEGSTLSYRWSGSPKPNDEIAPTVTLGIGHYVFTLTVTDSGGLSASDTVEVTVASPSNTPPVARIAATPLSGGAPLAVQFDGSNSSDSDSGGSIVSYQWDFGDNTSSISAAPLHTYTQPGQYTATLIVTDDGGAIGTVTQTIDVALIVAPSANTVIYQFLGNLYANPAFYDPTQPLLVYAHESNHVMKALLDFDGLDAQLSTLSAGHFTATLNLYVVCARGAGANGVSYVDGCPGDADADSPGGVATVTTDIRAQGGQWQETDAAVTWSSIQEGVKYASFTVNHTGYWVGVDVTSLVEVWRTAGSTGYGIVLTQQAYPVVRTDANDIAVVGIESRASAQTGERPYLEIHKSGP